MSTQTFTSAAGARSFLFSQSAVQALPKEVGNGLLEGVLESCFVPAKETRDPLEPTGLILHGGAWVIRPDDISFLSTVASALSLLGAAATAAAGPAGWAALAAAATALFASFRQLELQRVNLSEQDVALLLILKTYSNGADARELASRLNRDVEDVTRHLHSLNERRSIADKPVALVDQRLDDRWFSRV